MTYNERVRALAEKMAKKEYEKDPDTKFSYSKGHIKISWEAHSQKQEMIHQCMDCARIAVAEMAELAKQWMASYAWTTEYLREYLIKEGLIPDAQEGGNDGK